MKKNILLCCSSKSELQPLINLSKAQDPFYIIESENLHVCIFVTGIGTPLTLVSLMKVLNTFSFDLAIQSGICGSFSKKLNIGDTVCVCRDTFADLLIDDNGSYNMLSAMNFNDYSTPPFNNGFIEGLSLPMFDELSLVNGITVNTTTGSFARKLTMANLYSPDVESMEGCAFFLACNTMNLRYTQIRTISNYVGKRSDGQWNIPLAVENLNVYLKRKLLKLEK